MIDVLLVLLVIFMLTQTSRRAFDVNLPPRDDAPSPAAVPSIVLELPAAGGYAVNGQRFTAEALPAYLRNVYRDRSAAVLFIRAAAVRPYRDVVEAVDVARGAGVQVIGYMP